MFYPSSTSASSHRRTSIESSRTPQMPSYQSHRQIQFSSSRQSLPLMQRTTDRSPTTSSSDDRSRSTTRLPQRIGFYGKLPRSDDSQQSSSTPSSTQLPRRSGFYRKPDRENSIENQQSRNDRNQNYQLSFKRSGSFTYQNNGEEEKLRISSSNSRNEHILTTYSRANTPKGSSAGEVVQATNPAHKDSFHYDDDSQRGQDFHNKYQSIEGLLYVAKTTDLKYDADNIESILK